MFPIDFAFKVIDQFGRGTGRRWAGRPGGVLDPFAGRGSSVFAAAARGHRGFGIEINLVGWIYGDVKLAPAEKEAVLDRLEALATIADGQIGATALEAAALPEFFEYCFAPSVRRFLVTARQTLLWNTSRVDRTLMALILVYLHGKRGYALSNQMRDGKAMAPDYSVAWWKERGMAPPEVDVRDFLARRITWRYKKGRPELSGGSVVLGDSTEVLPRLADDVTCGRRRPFSLLFTSPPYCGVTNYHYDQWLRLWMLGGTDRPVSSGGPHRGKFESEEGYRALIENVFQTAAIAMRSDAVIYVRTDAREFTLETTVAALTRVFPRHRINHTLRPMEGRSQTALFGDYSEKPGEVDLVLTR